MSNPSATVGSSTGKIIDDGRFVLQNVIERTSQATIYMAYDGLLSTRRQPVYFVVAQILQSEYDRITACGTRIPKHRGGFPRLIACEREEKYFIMLNRTPVNPPREVAYVDERRTCLLALRGSGAFASVYLAHDISSHRRRHHREHTHFVAVKRITRIPERRNVQLRELDIHKRIRNHPSVVTFHHAFKDNDAYYIVMDYLPEGDLYDQITKHGRYFKDVELMKNAFLQLLEAVTFLHQMGVYHRDLKPENVLTSHDGRRLQIADFGLATYDDETPEFGCGTHFFLPPESLAGPTKYSEKISSRQCDIWALGVILISMIVGRRPWDFAAPDDPHFRAFQCDPFALREYLPVSIEVVALCSRVLSSNVNRRFGLKDFKKVVKGIGRFVMDEEELRDAAILARGVAGEIGLTEPVRYLVESQDIGEQESDIADEIVHIPIEITITRTVEVGYSGSVEAEEPVPVRPIFTITNPDSDSESNSDSNSGTLRGSSSGYEGPRTPPMPAVRTNVSVREPETAPIPSPVSMDKQISEFSLSLSERHLYPNPPGLEQDPLKGIAIGAYPGGFLAGMLM